MKRRGAQDGVEHVGKWQMSAVGADEKHAGRKRTAIDCVRAAVPDVARRSFGKHCRRSIDADHDAAADGGMKLGRQPSGSAAEIENALAGAGREPFEHAAPPSNLGVG